MLFRSKMVARRVSSHRATIEESHDFEEEVVENPFNDRDLIKQLVDCCILPDVVQRIIRTDLEQWVWDSLGSFSQGKQIHFPPSARSFIQLTS